MSGDAEVQQERDERAARAMREQKRAERAARERRELRRPSSVTPRLSELEG